MLPHGICVACPNKEELCKVNGNLNSDKIALEKMCRDECEKVLLAVQKKKQSSKRGEMSTMGE